MVECVVYGVPVPGNEGKAGMAAIVADIITDTELGKKKLQKKLSKIFKHFFSEKLYDHLTKNLQKHSRPVFIRKVDQIPKTANYKNRKVELVADGFKNVENVWILQNEKYVQLTEELSNQLKDEN